MITNELLKSYVDPKNGLISPHIFSSQEIYELELERVFGRTWLFLAHESQIPKPGTSSPPTWAPTRCSSCVRRIGR